MVINYIKDKFFMTINSSKDSKREDLSNSTELQNEAMTCKDGFCFIPNQNEKNQIHSDNINIFDPI